jgi:hypothetical protein
MYLASQPTERSFSCRIGYYVLVSLKNAYFIIAIVIFANINRALQQLSGHALLK